MREVGLYNIGFPFAWRKQQQRNVREVTKTGVMLRQNTVAQMSEGSSVTLYRIWTLLCWYLGQYTSSYLTLYAPCIILQCADNQQHARMYQMRDTVY